MVERNSRNPLPSLGCWRLQLELLSSVLRRKLGFDALIVSSLIGKTAYNTLSSSRRHILAYKLFLGLFIVTAQAGDKWTNQSLEFRLLWPGPFNVQSHKIAQLVFFGRAQLLSFCTIMRALSAI